MADVLTREKKTPITTMTKPKPREWSYFRTETPGLYQMLVKDPGGKLSVLSEVQAEISVGKIGVISVRTAFGVVDKPVEVVE